MANTKQTAVPGTGEAPAQPNAADARDTKIAQMERALSKANETNLSLTKELEAQQAAGTDATAKIGELQQALAEKDAVIETLKAALTEATTHQQVKVLEHRHRLVSIDGEQYVATQNGFWLPGDTAPTMVQDFTEEQLAKYKNDPNFFERL